MSFAPVTEEFDVRFARTLPPAARTLWTWLRRMAPPEREIEFCLKDFAQQFSYTLKWGRHALTALAEHGLVEIVRRYYGYGFKVLVFQPGDIRQKSSPSREETSFPPNKTSQKPASNPHSHVPLNKENIKIKQNPENPTPHPVLNEQEMMPEALEIGQGSEYEELFQEVEQAGIILNSHLKQILLQATVQTIRNAIAAFHEQKQKGNINKNPSGFFRRAVEQQFKPNSERLERRSREATPIAEAQREPVQREYARVGIDPHPAVPPQVIYPPVRPDDDVSDILAQIKIYHRQLGLSLEDVKAHFQRRYGKDSSWMLSEDELADWLQYLQQMAGGSRA